jgi:SAM-dependent methyltransferase
MSCFGRARLNPYTRKEAQVMSENVLLSSKECYWDVFWSGFNPEIELRMQDFYGGRQWILKHVPRYGKVLEAGCGYGRWVFYLSRLGIDIEGLDFHAPTLKAVSDWGRANRFDHKFILGDVCELPYASDTLSGYLSFGVIEHFQEGPMKALSEVYRVLRPGGIAIITTPSASLRFMAELRKLTKTVIYRAKQPFSNYWYSPHQLAGFVRQAGIQMMLFGGFDLNYLLWDFALRRFSPFRNKFAFQLAMQFERTSLANYGGQSFTISIKPAPIMYCFLCGRYCADLESLETFSLPVCSECAVLPLARYYKRRRQKRHRLPRFDGEWEYNPPRAEGSMTCCFCERGFELDHLFEDYGFSVPVCPDCLKNPAVNLLLSNKYLKLVWRRRH